jgi:predicted nucleic acid-binding protein
VRYLLDASALLPLVTRLGKELIAKAAREWFATTDLAIYEACNALWKLSTLLRSISLDDGIETAGVLQDLTERDIIHLVSLNKPKLGATLRFACDEKLTFYDASYVMAAKDESAVLVTEDEKLRESARRHVEVMSFKSLERKLAEE